MSTFIDEWPDPFANLPLRRAVRRRPKLPTGKRLAVYERDGYACRECGFSVPKPDGYRGHGRLGLVVGTARKLTYFKPSWTDKPDVRIYTDIDVVRYIEVDHIIPLICGGSSDLSNLQTLCGTCNNRKGASV